MRLSDLPSVDRLAAALADTGLPRVILTETARSALERARAAARDGGDVDPERDAREVLGRLRRRRPTELVNATGVLLHTNLGRAPLAEAALAAAGESARGYSPIEFDLDEGRRGGRGAYPRELLTALTGAEAALVVNNNAGALFLALAALAGGGRVIVSRGELIEIGGSFRLPELMAASGAALVEVGTTNRTRRADYEAVADEAALLLKVHPSNYRIEGFTEEVDFGAAAAIASAHGLRFVADVGSGLLDARVPWIPGPPPAWLEGEPGVRQTLEAGADVVLFSGDKLLGGPQAGIAVGRSDAVAAMARHPAARALRSGGPVLAALAATLDLYAADRVTEIPFWEMATRSYADLERRCRAVVAAAGVEAAVIEGASVPGAGSVPGRELPSPVIRVEGPADELWHRLLRADPPIVARRQDEHLLLDLRAVAPSSDDHIAAALERACR